MKLIYMKNKKIFFSIVASLILLLVLLGYLIVRNRVVSTEHVLGPGYDGLEGTRKIQLALQCYPYLTEFDKPLNNQKGRTILEIGTGEGALSVIERIAADLDADSEVLRLYLVYTGSDRLIHPGRYVLDGSMSVRQITDLLSASGNSLVLFSFFSGMRLEELAELIDTYGFKFTGADFLELAQNYPSALHPAGKTSLEGYFVPGTYEMSRDISLEDFLSNFVNVFRRRVQQPYEEQFSRNGLTLHQAVIMASMIAREAMSESEYGTIASVFYNRLSAGMKFESDPTAQYGIGYDDHSRSWWKMPLTASDVAVVSEYNTYIINGFPPGPICSPETAIYKAVAFPENTDYYYFRARCDNTPYHNFSQTYEEHASKYCR